jgi:hypothetical protein
MKWVGFVYIPVILIFVAVFLLVQYRIRVLEVESRASGLSMPNATSSVTLLPAE